jgi:hypothetical protein
MKSRMRKVRDSSGVLVIVLGSVMAVMALVGLFGGDPGSLAVFLPLAAAAFGADLVLRRRSGRPAAADLYVVGAIFAIFAMLFGFNRDWRLVAACAAIAVISWTLSSVLYNRYVRRRRLNGSPSSSL